MLSRREQQMWTEIERFYGDEDEEPDRGGRRPAGRSTRRARGHGGMIAVAVGAACIALMFVLVGTPVAGLVVGGAAALGWLAWRYWPEVGAACETAFLPMLGGADGPRHGPADDASPSPGPPVPQAD